MTKLAAAGIDPDDEESAARPQRGVSSSAARSSNRLTFINVPT
jgi:hypothetical protein